MRKAGIREARQNLTALLEEVRKGHEVLITDRGKPVARLVPPNRRTGRPFPNMSAFRATMPVLDPPASQAIIEDRDSGY